MLGSNVTYILSETHKGLFYMSIKGFCFYPVGQYSVLFTAFFCALVLLRVCIFVNFPFCKLLGMVLTGAENCFRPNGMGNKYNTIGR